jgi:hypothetical protein
MFDLEIGCSDPRDEDATPSITLRYGSTGIVAVKSPRFKHIFIHIVVFKNTVFHRELYIITGVLIGIYDGPGKSEQTLIELSRIADFFCGDRTRAQKKGSDTQKEKLFRKTV